MSGGIINDEAGGGVVVGTMAAISEDEVPSHATRNRNSQVNEGVDDGIVYRGSGIITKGDLARRLATSRRWQAKWGVEQDVQPRRSGLVTNEDLARRVATSRRWRAKWAKDDENGVRADRKSVRSIYCTYAGLKSASKRKRPEGNAADTRNVWKGDRSTSLRVSSCLSSIVAREGPRSSGWGPERKGRRPPTSAVTERLGICSRVIGKSSWYENIDMKAGYGRSDLISLRSLLTMIAECTKASRSNDPERVRQSMIGVRKKIHDMEFYASVSGVLIKKSGVLEDEGLPAIFSGSNRFIFASDIRADAEALYRRWMCGDIDPHLLRHIVTEKLVFASGRSRTASKIDPTWQRKSSSVVGDNGIVNGQWWPNRVCLMRDGGHGEIEAGISGQVGCGAYSVVVARGGYKDDDLGEVIHYCGTESVDTDATKNTRLMLEAEDMRQAVRVFRSENPCSDYAPRKGIRYDGIYMVKSHSIVDIDTAMHVFRLERVDGQDPIRYRGPEARPTDQEVVSYMGIVAKLATMK